MTHPVWSPLLPGGAQTQAATSVNGSASQTIAAVTQSAAGTVTVAGSAAQTIAAFTQTATATVTVAGAAAQAIDAVTQSAAGTVTVAGSAAQTIAALTQAATGAVTVAGQASQTVAAVTQAAEGTIGALPAISGAASQTVAAFEQTATGTAAQPAVTARGGRGGGFIRLRERLRGSDASADAVKTRLIKEEIRAELERLLGVVKEEAPQAEPVVAAEKLLARVTKKPAAIGYAEASRILGQAQRIADALAAELRRIEEDNEDEELLLAA